MAVASERSEKIGVLQTVQLHHARSRHAFAPAESTETLRNSISRSPTPVQTRPQSTLAETTSEEVDRVLPPSPQAGQYAHTGLSTDPSAPQTTLPYPIDQDDPRSEDYHRLIAARDAKDPALAAEAVAHLRGVSANPLVPEFNAGLEALYQSRRAGEPLTVILETYNDMLSRGLLPNFRTYHLLLKALTDRDYEVDWAIKGIEMRRKWRSHLGIEDSTDLEDTSRLEKFRSETNFASAMSVFQALVSLNAFDLIDGVTLNNLLRSCAIHDNVDAAIQIWSHIENRPGFLPLSSMFKHLVAVFARAGDVKAAQEIFKDFRKRSFKGEIAWEVQNAGPAHLAFYNTMIEAYFNCGLPDMAISLLDEMIDTSTSTSTPLPSHEANTAPIVRFSPTRPPAPGSSTFSTIISGFCRSKDMDSALVWFKRLLQQKFKSGHPFYSTIMPTRPDVIAWRYMIEHLSVNGRVDELNELISTFIEKDLRAQDGIELRHLERHYVQQANLNKVHELIASMTDSFDLATVEKAKGYLDFLLSKKMLIPKSLRDQGKSQAVWEAYIQLGYPHDALRLLQDFCDGVIASRKDGRFAHALLPYIASFRDRFNQRFPNPPFTVALSVANYANRFNAPPNVPASIGLLQSYAAAKQQGSVPLTMTLEDWTTLLLNAAEAEVLAPSTIEAHVPDYAFQGLLSLLEDFPRDSPHITFAEMDADSALKILKAATLVHGHDTVKELASAKLEPSVLSILNSQNSPSIPPPAVSSSSDISDTSASSSPSLQSTTATSISSPEAAQAYEAKRYFVDPKLTGLMEETIHKALYRSNLDGVCEALLKMFFDHCRKGVVPSAYVVGKMIGTLGRGGDAVGAKRVYTKMQDVLASMSNQPAEQAETWFLIEDSMIIALAQAGDIDGAHVHRLRILEQGGAPSADAYGGLILGVRDTTDDTSNAMALFQESQMQGVQANQYLFNNIISKLAKARKADQALELFHQMRQAGIQTSSITYGALIGACARVGDVESAETLFSEMIQQPNFKPRVPPYNTMMQLYTTTKPNRERSLHYYNQMLAAGVMPTPYTFKLLMETYVLEPINIQKVESVFNTVLRNPKVELQGTHFATLINAYGCVMKDLDKALAIFHSVPSNSRGVPLDALIVESTINVIVAHRRMDLLPEIIAKMTLAGVHMTAYIVNAMIRGFAITGDLSQAREVFESLIDPPTGVAGMHNHAPHDPSAATPVKPMEPVYREPSTWEAMVRAELGAGHRDRATALLERLKTRQYPEAVFNRIGGILVDHTMIPMN